MLDDDNPYSRDKEEVREYKPKVFSRAQVMTATFCATLFCTAFMIERNYKAFGDPVKARKMFWILIACAVVVTGISISLPGYRMSTALSIGVIFVVGDYYKKNFSEKFVQYLNSGGLKVGNWKVFGMIMLTLIIVMSLLVGVLIGLEEIGMVLPE